MAGVDIGDRRGTANKLQRKKPGDMAYDVLDDADMRMRGM